uniref:Uncharacterized protein n=1 Tax=Anguilla anguilla TaxID=7936 RepID=A0A0E9WDM9_ANGAN
MVILRQMSCCAFARLLLLMPIWHKRATPASPVGLSILSHFHLKPKEKL